MPQLNRQPDLPYSTISDAGGYECENCKRRFRRESSVCPHCEFPINGAKEDKELFYAKLAAAKHQLQGLREKVDRAKGTLLIISAINFIYAFVYYFSYHEIEDANLIFILNLLAACLFFLLALAAKDNPFTALTIGLILYLILNLYHFLDDQPASFLLTFMRDVFIIWIVKGISNTYTVEELKREIRKRQPK